MKRTQLLPLASHKVKHIQLDKSILVQCVIPFINDQRAAAWEDPDIFKAESVEACFPGLARLRPRKATFQGSIKTDGVSVSVVFTRPRDETQGEEFKIFDFK